MTLGPLEYIVIGFEGGHFDGTVAREIEAVVDKKVIRLIDVVFISKDANGKKLILEIDEKSDPRFEAFAPLLADRMALFTPDDLERLAASLPDGTAGLAMLFEHRWAEQIKEAMQAKGGSLITRVVVPPEVLGAVSAEIEAEKSSASAAKHQPAAVKG